VALPSNSSDTRPIRNRHWLLVVACVSAAVTCFYFYEFSLRSRLSTPTIDLSGVHPDVAQGIRSAVQVIDRRPESGLAWGHFGMTLWAHEYVKEALVCFAQAEQLSPDEIRWPYFQGIILSNRDRKAAAKAFSTAASCDPNQPLPLIKLCEILLETDQLEAAGEILNRLFERTSDNAQVYLLAAYLADRQGHLERAIENARRSLAIAPDHARVISLLARLLNRDQQHAEAAVLNARLRNQPALENSWPDPLSAEVSSFRLDPYWNAYQAKQLIEHGDHRHGLKLLQTLVKQFPDEPTIRAQLARTLLNRGMTRQAMVCLLEATDHSHFELRLLRATAHLLLEEWEEAEEIYLDLVNLKPDSPSLLSELAFCQRQQGRFHEAIGPAQQAVTLAPEQVSYRVELIRILIQLKRIQQARNELRVVEKLNPADDEILRLRHEIDDVSSS